MGVTSICECDFNNGPAINNQHNYLPFWPSILPSFQPFSHIYTYLLVAELCPQSPSSAVDENKSTKT